MNLQRLYSDMTAVCDEYGFEVSLIGSPAGEGPDCVDSRLIKVYPRNLPQKVMLELAKSMAGNIYLYRHRTNELTSRYRGYVVTKQWVLAFMREHAESAQTATRVKDEREIAAAAQVMRREPEREEQRRHRGFIKSKECSSCFGRGNWQEGHRQDGDLRIVYCQVCRGSGFVAADEVGNVQ